MVMDHMPLEPYWGRLLMDFQRRAVTAGTPSVTVNRISIGRLKELLQNQSKHDFNENMVEKEMSREDQRLVEIMDKSVKIQDIQEDHLFDKKAAQQSLVEL